jgi:putative DNA primase/helicase
VKKVTGLGQIRARYLHERFFNFQPTHKIFLDCNHRPVITDPDDAVWNRVRCIPFLVTIPPEEIDTELPNKLRQELPGIARWLVEGAQIYLRNGLNDIPEVKAATEDYRQESDRLSDWIADECALEAGAEEHVTGPYRRYLSWADREGEKYPLGKNIFEDRLKKKGCRKGKTKSGSQRVWLGIRPLHSSPEGQPLDNRTSSDKEL